jgi:hypothetical protein
LVADRNVLPSNTAQYGVSGPTDVLNLHPALEGDEGPELEGVKGAFAWNFREMSRAIDVSVADFAAIGNRMTTQVAKIAGGKTAQQVEVDDDFALLNLGGVVRVSQANFLI